MEYVQGNIFIREMRFDKAGDCISGHTHNFDHTTYVAKGEVLIEAVDEAGDVLRSRLIKASDGFNFVLIKASIRHRLTAKTDDCIAHCIYAHRNPQGDVVQAYDGWAQGYV